MAQPPAESTSSSQSFRLSSKVLFGTLAALKESGGTAEKKGLLDRLQGDLELTPWELEPGGKHGNPRWRKYLNFKTTEAVRADWLIKDWGTWTLTEAGHEALETHDPDSLCRRATEAYQEWRADTSEEEDGDGAGDEGESRTSNLTWTRKHILYAALHRLEGAPGHAMEGKDLLQQLPRLVPEDVAEALQAHDPDWPSTYGVNRIYLMVRVGWMLRVSGTWSLTSAGLQALAHYQEPADLYQAARALVGKDKTDLPPPPYMGAVVPSGELPQTVYSNQTATVSHLVSEIAHGTLALPDIQRPFVWKNSKVRDLLDSMFRGFPFGFILTWRSMQQTRTKAIGEAAGAGRPDPHALIIDGQQRLTSLYAVMTGKPVLDRNFKTRHIRIAFHPIRAEFQVADAAIARNPEWLPDVSAVFTSEGGPIGVIQEYLQALESARELEPAHRRAAEQNILRLAGLKNVQLNVLEISERADEEQVAEIFVRINSKGQNLKQADFILTLLAVFWEEGREQLENFARDCRLPSTSGAASPFNHLLQPGAAELIRVVVALSHRRARLSAAYQVLRGKNPVTGAVDATLREQQLRRLEQAQRQVLDPADWHEFLKTLQAAGYVAPSMLTSNNAALMAYAYFLLGRRHFGLKLEPLRALVGRWFSFTMITGRYGGSPESIMEEDLAQLRELQEGDARGFQAALERLMENELTEDFWSHTLPARLESSRVQTLNPFFAAQIKLGAKCLWSDAYLGPLMDPAISSTKKALEAHHLFPKAWLLRQGVIDRRAYNQIANLTQVEWHSNNDIGDRDPKDYGPEYAPKATPETAALHAMPERWWEMEYDAFLVSRRRLMADVIRRGMGV